MVPNKFYNKGAAKPHNKNKNQTKLPKIETKISKEKTENNSKNRNKDSKNRLVFPQIESKISKNRSKDFQKQSHAPKKIVKAGRGKSPQPNQKFEQTPENRNKDFKK